MQPGQKELKELKTAGDIAESTVKHCIAVLPADLMARLVENVGQGVKLSTACSGSGMAEAYHILVHQVLKKEAVVSFACEKTPNKREWYLRLIEPRLAKPECLFVDITELGSGTAKCAKHEQSCPVPVGQRLLVCGFSCKDLSKLSSTLTEEEKACALAKSSGTTSSTFRGLLEVTELTKPDAIIMEDVDLFTEDKDTGTGGMDVEDSDSFCTNLPFLIRSFRSLGYMLNYKRFSSAEYGVPQGRIRVYFVGVRLDVHDLTEEDATTMLNKIMAETDRFKIDPVPLPDLLLQANHPHVQHEKQQLQSGGKRQSGNKSEQVWKKEHEAFFKSKGLSWRDLKMPEVYKGNAWFDGLPQRSKEIVIYHGHLCPTPPGKRRCV